LTLQLLRLSFDNYGVCVSGVICFEDLTTYTLPQSYTVARYWDFGDGTPIDTAENPCHFYAQPGGYITKLYVRSNLGCFDSLVTTVVVVPEFPVAGFYATRFFGMRQLLQFVFKTHLISIRLPGQIIGFGIGAMDNVDTTNTLETFATSYSTGGYYRVTMCVYDSVGCPDCDSSVVVRVIDNPIARCWPRSFCLLWTDRTTTLVLVVQYLLWLPSSLVSNDAIYNPTTLLLNDATIIFPSGRYVRL
jgi:hypothetical protein